jgi:hypothetical protein
MHARYSPVPIVAVYEGEIYVRKLLISRAGDLQPTPELLIEISEDRISHVPIPEPAAFPSLSISQLSRRVHQMITVKVFPCIAS